MENSRKLWLNLEKGSEENVTFFSIFQNTIFDVCQTMIKKSIVIIFTGNMLGPKCKKKKKSKTKITGGGGNKTW